MVLRQVLEKELRAIRDDDDFVFCTTTILETDDNAEEFIAYLETARERREPVSHDDAVFLAIAIDEGL